MLNEKEAYDLMFDNLFIQKIYPKFCPSEERKYLYGMYLTGDLYVFAFQYERHIGTKEISSGMYVVNRITGECFFEDSIVITLEYELKYGTEEIDFRKFQK